MKTNILCIEDEFFISELYARALNKAGYETTISTNGIDGLELAKTNKYDIILLDLMIPGIYGVDVLRKLRDPAALTQFKSKIIITTNLDVDDATRADLEKLADGYLVKADITPKQLVEFLQTIMPAEKTESAEM